MHHSDEKIINIRDLIAELLYAWKKILIFMIIFTVLGAGFGEYKIWKINRDEALLEAEQARLELEEENKELIDQAKENLTSMEIEEVERLHDQLVSYVDYREILQDDFSSYMSTNDDGTDEKVIKRISYKLSTSVQGANNMFVTMALGIDDYKKIMEILPEADTLTTAYNYVFLGSLAGNSVELVNMGDNSLENPSQYMIYAEMVGNNRSICDEIENVVDDSFQRVLSELKQIDPDAELTFITSQYKGNIYDYISQKKQSTFETIQKVDTTINNLKNNSIAKLTKRQKRYYNLLKDPEKRIVAEEEEEEELEEEESPGIIFPVKEIVVGAFLGLFLAVFLVFVQYIMNGKINVQEEIEDIYHISVLNTVFVRGKRKGLFPGVISNLKNTDSCSIKEKTRMIVADINGLIQKTEDKSLYLMRISDAPVDNKLISMVERSISESNSECQINSGAPLDDVIELENITHQKNAVVFVHIKETGERELERLCSICERHQVKVLGAVAISEI